MQGKLKYMSTQKNVDSEFIHSSQKLETTVGSLNKWMDKWVGVSSYSGFTRMGHKGNSGVMEMFYIFMVMVLALRYKFVKTNCKVQLSRCTLFLYKLYPNKKILMDRRDQLGDGSFSRLEMTLA